MRSLASSISRIWHDDRGFVVSIELILVATVGLLGLLAGTAAIRDGMVAELSDVAGSIQDLNQSYSYFGIVGHSGSNAGSDYEDGLDFCDSAEDASGQADNCILFTLPPGFAPGRVGGGGGPGAAGG